jgi:nucleotide-binding universal stress UspA family protein
MAMRILVPLDGSALAEQALAWAATLSRELPAELVLLRAVLVPPEAQDILDQAGAKRDALLDQLEAEAVDYLTAQVEPLKDAGLSARYTIEHGPAAEAIVDSVRRMSIRQIVMATHGYSGIKRWTHGSVAERVLQTASVPVLLVRAQDEDKRGDWRQPMPCQRILVPLDGSRMAEQVLPMVTTIAQALDAELILFQVPIAHVYGWMTGEWFLPVQAVLDTAEHDAQAYLSHIATHLPGLAVRVSTTTKIGSVAACIIDYAESNQIDLIAMCTHGRTGLARWALGSVADRVLRAGNTPILLVRATLGKEAIVGKGSPVG